MQKLQNFLPLSLSSLNPINAGLFGGSEKLEAQKLWLPWLRNDVITK